MPSRIVGNSNETFFAHLSTWLKSTPSFPQRFTSQKLVASYFGIHSRTYKNHQNNFEWRLPTLPGFAQSDPKKAAMTSFLILLSAYYFKPTNQPIYPVITNVSSNYLMHLLHLVHMWSILSNLSILDNLVYLFWQSYLYNHCLSDLLLSYPTLPIPFYHAISYPHLPICRTCRAVFLLFFPYDLFVCCFLFLRFSWFLLLVSLVEYCLHFFPYAWIWSLLQI